MKPFINVFGTATEDEVEGVLLEYNDLLFCFCLLSFLSCLRPSVFVSAVIFSWDALVLVQLLLKMEARSDGVWTMLLPPFPIFSCSSLCSFFFPCCFSPCVFVSCSPCEVFPPLFFCPSLSLFSFAFYLFLLIWYVAFLWLLEGKRMPYVHP